MDKIEKIIWTYDGINSFEEIVSFISKDSAFYAGNFATKILDSIEKLFDFPLLGRIVPEYNIRNIRELIFQNYRIIYQIIGKEIYILLVIHGSKPLPENII